jgi:hypothetical protein
MSHTSLARCAAPLIVLLASGCGRSDDAIRSLDPPVQKAASNVVVSSEGCGRSGLPDCPLQGWMKANLASALQRQDFDRLESAFARLGSMKPRELGAWSDFAKHGEDAAHGHNIEECRQACKQCHDAYRSSYRQTYRLRPAR